MPIADLILTDETEVEKFHLDSDGRMLRSHRSLYENAIMEQNRALRSQGGGRKLEWAQWLLSMSEAQYLYLVKLFPALRYGNAEERTKAWIKIANDGAFRNLHVKG